MMPSKNLPLLLNSIYAAYNRALPNADGTRGDFQPVFNGDGTLNTSYCNEFVATVCNAMGYDKLNGLDADDIFKVLSTTAGDWITQDEVNAQNRANLGVIVIAAWTNPAGHGHVALLIPGILENSNSAGKKVPKIVSVGKAVMIGKRTSMAFSYPDEAPTFFALSGMI